MFGNDYEHFENHCTLKYCCYGQIYNFFILQNLNLRSDTDSYVTQIGYSNYELLFPPNEIFTC